MRPERASSSDVSWRRLLDSRTQEAVITGSSALHEDIICLILLRPGQDSVSRHLQCIIHHRGAAAGFLFMLRSFWNQQSSLLSCWHWQRDCYPCCGSWAVSLHHSGVVSKSDDMIGQMCGAAVTGQQCLLWRESRLSEVCWSQSQGPTKTPRGDSVLLLCVCVCVCRCALSALVSVAKPSIKLPWQPSVHHPIHHPRATDGATERGERCHGRVER